MAKITIKIEDSQDGKHVNCVITPTGQEIAKMIIGGQKTTSAHGLALAAINAILLEKKRQQKGIVILPKLIT